MRPTVGQQQQGMALIIVLGLAALFSVLVAMFVMSGKISGVTSKVSADRSTARYAAESATGYAQWLTMTFNFNNPNAVPPGEDDVESRWEANGRHHMLNMGENMVAKVKVLDVNRGQNITTLLNRGSQAQIVNQRALDDSELSDALNEFFAVFADYTDRDSRPNHPDFGMELEDYEVVDLPNFPRNGNLQFREELYWMRNVESFVSGNLPGNQSGTVAVDMLRLIAPTDGKGKVTVHGGDPGGKVSFFSASEHWLKLQVPDGLSDDELQLIRDCRANGYQDRYAIDNCLGEALAARLEQVVTFERVQTQVFTFDVVAGYPGNDIVRRVVSTMNLKNIPNAPKSSVGQNNQVLQLWQRQTY